MWLRAPLPSAEDAAALAWAPHQTARWETECLSTVTLPRCSQGWSTWVPAHQLHTWESLEVTTPSLPLTVPWAGAISYNPCLDFHAVTYRPELPCCSWSQQAGFAAHPQLLGAFQGQPAAFFGSHSAVLPSFCLQLLKTCLPKSPLLLANGKCYLPEQSEISPIFPPTLLKPWMSTWRWQPLFGSEFPLRSCYSAEVLLGDYRSTILLLCHPVSF